MEDTKQTALDAVEQTGLVSIIRMDDLECVRRLAGALYAGGVRCFEVPMTAPNAADIIRAVKGDLPADAVVGAGTVLSAADAEAIIDAGAVFVVSPHYEPEVGDVCKARGVGFIPGAFSPLEVYRAWRGGADIVKVFSIRAAGGATYLSDLKGPYPYIKLMPTGGISLQNATDFIRAGAVAVTVGRDLLGKGPWDDAALKEMARRAADLLARIREARAR